MKQSKRFFLFIVLFIAFNIQSQAQPENPINPEKIDIVRDEWGVPHIFAKTDAEVAYGLGWATCEDDFETLQWTILAAKAMLGRHLGKDGAIIDYANHLLRISETVEEKYDESLTEPFKKILEAYAAGVNKYASMHKSEVLVKKAFPITPQDIVKGYSFAMALMSGIDDVLKSIIDGTIMLDSEGFRGVGSNAFAFNSSITKDGHTYLAINSHQPLEGPLSWYEVHLCSEEGWNIVGGLFHGGVSVFHGTNENLGWAHTYNDFDVIDVFQLEMNPENNNQYKFDGEWLELEEKKAKLVVRLFDNLKLCIPVKKKVWWSKYGATLKTDHGVFAVRLAANQVIKAPEQWYRMNKATNFSEFKKALDIQGLARMTVVYADRYDTIFALSNGLVPERNKNFDWKGVVPGNTSATLWKHFHPVDDLPQNLNPDCGYVFNVNNTPFNATCDQFCESIEDYDRTMGYDMKETNRSLRFKELMDHYGRSMIDWDDFLDIKYDAQMPDSMIFFQGININDIFRLDPKKYPDIADAIGNIKNWNRKANLDNTNITVFLYAFYNIYDEIQLHPINIYNDDKVAREGLFVRGIRKAKKELINHFGTIDIPLRDVQFIVRGDKALPVGGCPDAIKAAYTKPYKDGKRKIWVGESYIQLVNFTKDGPQIESVSPFGANNKLGCPHSTDQMDLYVNEKRKKMSLNKDTVYQHAEMIYHPQ